MILTDLLARVPGALGAVVVDAEGESVDYAGSLPPFDLKLAAAHWQIALSELRAHRASTDPVFRSLVVRSARRSFIVRLLAEGYTLVVVLGRRAGFTRAARAFAVCDHELFSEAGWPLLPRTPPWFAVSVKSTPLGRPTHLILADRPQALEIVGRVASMRGGDHGWRVRLANGAELTLFREPGGHWYAEEPPETLAASEPRPPRACSRTRRGG